MCVSSSPELWPEYPKKVHKCCGSVSIDDANVEIREMQRLVIWVEFISGLCISCLGDNHNGWHKPSENKSTEYRVQSTEYRVQIYLDLSYHGGTMMA